MHHLHLAGGLPVSPGRPHRPRQRAWALSCSAGADDTLQGDCSPSSSPPASLLRVQYIPGVSLTVPANPQTGHQPKHADLLLPTTGHFRT